MAAFIILIIWLLCAIPTAAIAERKNRNAVAWFLVGGIFGVLGIAAVLLLPPSDSVWSAGDNSGYGGGGGGSESSCGGGCGGGGCGGGGCGGGG